MFGTVKAGAPLGLGGEEDLNIKLKVGSLMTPTAPTAAVARADVQSMQRYTATGNFEGGA